MTAPRQPLMLRAQADELIADVMEELRFHLRKETKQRANVA
ncbi:MAG: hypothetical protein R3E31_20160 [Chloroflexota bacterium]